MIQLFQSSYIRWYKNDFTLCACDDNVLKMYRIKVRMYCIVISLYLVCVPYLCAKCMHVCIRESYYCILVVVLIMMSMANKMVHSKMRTTSILYYISAVVINVIRRFSSYHGFSLGIHCVCCAYVMIIYLKSTVKVRREYSYYSL